MNSDQTNCHARGGGGGERYTGYRPARDSLGDGSPSSALLCPGGYVLCSGAVADGIGVGWSPEAEL